MLISVSQFNLGAQQLHQTARWGFKHLQMTVGMKAVQLTSESFESEKWLHKNRSAQTHPQIARITAASVVEAAVASALTASVLPLSLLLSYPDFLFHFPFLTYF